MVNPSFGTTCSLGAFEELKESTEKLSIAKGLGSQRLTDYSARQGRG